MNTTFTTTDDQVMLRQAVFAWLIPHSRIPIPFPKQAPARRAAAAMRIELVAGRQHDCVCTTASAASRAIGLHDEGYPCRVV